MRRLAQAVVLALGLAGCAVVGEVPQDVFYRLDLPAPPAAARPVLPGVLEIARFSGDGLTTERALIYVSGAEDGSPAIRQYRYHYWAETPTRLLADALTAFARAANLAETVVGPDLRLRPDYTLTGRIMRLEQVLGPAPKAVVELQLGLKRIAPRADDLLLLRTYREEEPLPGAGAPEAVAGIRAALADIFRRFAADVAALPAEALSPAGPESRSAARGPPGPG